MCGPRRLWLPYAAAQRGQGSPAPACRPPTTPLPAPQSIHGRQPRLLSLQPECPRRHRNRARVSATTLKNEDVGADLAPKREQADAEVGMNPAARDRAHCPMPAWPCADGCSRAVAKIGERPYPWQFFYKTNKQIERSCERVRPYRRVRVWTASGSGRGCGRAARPTSGALSSMPRRTAVPRYRRPKLEPSLPLDRILFP